MQRVLVAGATGYLGGFVVRVLKDRGYSVRALVRSLRKAGGLPDIADEVVVGQVTNPETLKEVCDNIDVVFSSVGITRQKDGLSFHDVDYRGNLNLLHAAQRAGVKRVVYVSVFGGPGLRHLDIVDAHEAFADELRASGIDFTVLRPTGYFSDMGELLTMARKGRVWLIGDGTNRVNPIHGADLAVACADAVEGGASEMDIGGPEAMTWNEAAELAFDAVGRPAKITHVPERLMWFLVRLVRLVNRHQGELLAFFTTAATTNVSAPAAGSHTLARHFSELLEQGTAKEKVCHSSIARS